MYSQLKKNFVHKKILKRPDVEKSCFYSRLTVIHCNIIFLWLNIRVRGSLPSPKSLKLRRVYITQSLQLKKGNVLTWLAKFARKIKIVAKLLTFSFKFNVGNLLPLFRWQYDVFACNSRGRILLWAHSMQAHKCFLQFWVNHVYIKWRITSDAKFINFILAILIYT